MRIRYFLTVSALALSIGAADAADLGKDPLLAAAPAIEALGHDWTGLYFGGHAGYGWSRLSASSLFDPTDPDDPIESDSLRFRGALGGFQGGYNIQFGMWVLGIEGEYSWSDMRETVVIDDDALHVKADWLVTASGRVGAAFDQLLIYAKVGGAWTRDHYTATDDGVPASGSARRSGWLVGGGVEYAFLDNWSAKIEYNYLDFGSRAVTVVSATDAETGNVDLTMHTVKVGVNYRFNWSAAPVRAKY